MTYCNAPIREFGDATTTHVHKEKILAHTSSKPQYRRINIIYKSISALNKYMNTCKRRSMTMIDMKTGIYKKIKT